MRLLFGSDPGSLIVQCLTELHSLTVDFPDQRAFLIVPEQIKVQMEQAYIDTTGTAGLMMAEVLSFRRLAHRLLDETGLLPGRRVDAFGRRMLLFRVLKENREQMHSFGHLADRSSFLAEVEAVVGDLKRHAISASQLQEAAAAGTEKSLADKCLDLATLLAGYNLALAENDIADADDDLERLAELLEGMAEAARREDGTLPFPYNRLHPLSRSHVYVSGFGFVRDFTPQEHRILAGLVRLGARLTVAVQADAYPTSEAAVEAGSEVFLIGRRTLHRLARRLGDAKAVRVAPLRTPLQEAVARVTAGAGIPDAPDTCAASVPEASSPSIPEAPHTCAASVPDASSPSIPEAPGVSSMVPGSQPASGANGSSPAAPGLPLTIIGLATEADEIEWMAGEIRRLTQSGGYRFRDMAIALCEPKVQMPLLRAAARRYGLSLFLDETRSLAGTSLLRYLLGLLDLPLRNWARDPLMTVLRSGLTPLDPQQVDILENDLLERGLFRRDRLFSAARTAGTSLGGPEDAAGQRIRETVLTVFEPMRQLTDSLRQAATTADCCRLIRAFFTEQGLTARIAAQADALRAGGEGDAALLLASAHAVLGQVLQQLETIAGALPMGLADLRDTLRSGLANASVTLIPSALDQIVVGDWRRISRQPCRILFVIGARLDGFPPKASPEGLLKDTDRQFLSEALAITLPSKARDQVFADAASLHQLLTRATDRLYLGASGGEPAEIVQRLRRALPDCRQISEDETADFWNPRLNARPAAWHRLMLLTGMAVDLPADRAAGWRTLARSLSACRAAGACSPLTRAVLPEDLPLGRGALFAPLLEPVALVPDAEGPATVDPETLAGIYSATPSMSVSQLEKYAACPFSHLVAYVLSLKERAVYAPEATDTGTLLHGVVELALRDLSERLAQADGDPEAIQRTLEEFRCQDLKSLTGRLMDAVIEREAMGVMNDTGIRADVGRRLRQMSTASLQAILDQLEPGGYLPQQLEWTFGPDEADRFCIDLPGQRALSLRGKVDRVDVRQPAEGPAEFRVVDYKSGNKKVDPDQLFHGLALQLPTYLAAYAASHPELLARDAGYFHFDRPMVRTEQAMDDDSAVDRKVAKAFELRTAGLEPDDLQRLLAHTRRRISELSQQLLSGHFAVAPRKLRGTQPACVYCTFSAICGFNRRDYRNLPSVTRLTGENGGRPDKKKALCRLLAESSEATLPGQPANAAGAPDSMPASCAAGSDATGSEATGSRATGSGADDAWLACPGPSPESEADQ